MLFQSLRKNLDVLALIIIGSFAVFSPLLLANKKGTPEELGKRVRFIKLAGVVSIVSGVGLSLLHIL